MVDRDFRPQASNLTWSADITYISTWEGLLYLAHVQDLFSRLIVGWSMADHLRSELVVDALEMALYRDGRPVARAVGLQPKHVLEEALGLAAADAAA